jgi:hypothetical protein
MRLKVGDQCNSPGTCDIAKASTGSVIVNSVVTHVSPSMIIIGARLVADGIKWRKRHWMVYLVSIVNAGIALSH